MTSRSDRNSPVTITGFPLALEANSWNIYSPGRPIIKWDYQVAEGLGK